MNKIRKEIFSKLSALGEDINKHQISEIIDNEDCENRVIVNEILNYDYSKQRIDKKSLDYLLKIPDFIDLKDSLEELFNGEFLNSTEDRTVSHTIYRNKNPIENYELIFSERERIRFFLEKITTDFTFKNLIYIGIGGSRTGPELLSEFQSLDDPIHLHFCSSYDLLELNDILNNCIQSETLVFVSSKSFTTSEIHKNLDHVKAWYGKNPDIDIKDHLYAISADDSAMTANGIKKANQFLVLDSLGGRFSVWSSMSLPAFVNSDFNSYLDFLEGARLADEHTNTTIWESNIPVMMALMTIWNTNSLRINNHGIFTYNYRLRSLTKYIAQLNMESNGKSINSESKESPFLTSPLIWGGYGIESQHSVFQWMMQGKTETACDFIGLNNGDKNFIDSYEMLLSQVLAMCYGKKDIENPYKSVRGNNPCSILQLNSLDLKSLGFLLALYEHKVFIEASILGIDPFDQWGVQLGKELALEAKSDKNFLKDNFSSVLHTKS